MGRNTSKTAVALAIALFTVACGDDTAPPAVDAGGVRDSGGGRDTGTVGDGCVPTAEECNGVDDDCDGMVDEGGAAACGLAHATAACTAGRCEVESCAAGFEDCDGDPTDGCEVEVAADPAHCGACGVACGSAISCIDGTCADHVIMVSAGGAHSCALRRGGGVTCWGDNASGQLGDGTDTTPSLTPVDVVDLPDAAAVSAGLEHTCALRLGGEVTCWGSDVSRQAGYEPSGALMDTTSTPVGVAMLADSVQVSAGGAHTCARDTRGVVRCWGSRQYGQLGNGDVGGAPLAEPQEVAGLTDALWISAGQDHSCAVRRSGRVVCWGRNGERLGDAGTTGDSGTPVEVDLIRDAVEVSAGAFVTCARRRMGEVTCWGPGLRGDGMASGGPPVDIRSITDALQLSAGGQIGGGTDASHACVLRMVGLVCWGDNESGQIGDGATARHTIPVPISVVDTVQVSAGAHHTCAVVPGGGVRCWGLNADGQVGDGTTADRTTPATVSGLP